MAGFADPRAAHVDLLTAPNAARPSSTRRPLPSGPCNYRDAASGQCGCDQFWDKLSAELHEESANPHPSRERSTWCVCGHHACFHLRGSRAPEYAAPVLAPAIQATQAKCSGQCQLLPGTQCDIHNATRLVPGHGTNVIDHATYNGQYKALQSGGSQQLLRQAASPAQGPHRMEQGWDAPSQASTTGLPSIPSVCMLSRGERPAADTEARYDVNQSRQTVAGLGLSMMQLGSTGALNRQQSPSPTIPDDSNPAPALQEPLSKPEISPTRASLYAANAKQVTSPSRGILDHVLEFNRNLQLDVPGDTIPNTFNPDDYIQSATEVATPSMTNTPDLGVADQAVQEGKNLIDTLTRLTSNMQQPTGSPEKTGATSAPSSQRSAAAQEQLQQILRAASPQALQKLVSYLAPLHNLLNSIPNVANTMRDMGNRLDMLENGSFNYVQPEDLNQMLSMHDDRLVELEHRMDEHDKHHQAIDADQSSTSYARRRIDNITGSFASNHSFQSDTSSALILAAMDRKDTEMEFNNIKDRLDVLESAALPSTFQLWEVEIVLIPWGRDLRGIWFTHDEPMHDIYKATQESEDWTQARNSKLAGADGPIRETDSSPYHGPRTMSRGVISDTEGWSSQAISDWASGSADDWLFPKACGSNNLVYKRLQSRGFVRDVTLKGASARDLQAALSHAFSDLLEHLSYTNQDGDEVVTAYPGLQASFIPLRKVHKDSRLRFLSPAEMATSALWSAQFLASGVMMRVSGGKKRLYVTQREAYIQHSDDLGSTWTWQELRQLPRFKPDQDSRMEGNDEQCQSTVPEADAKETCWQYVEAYDAPPASVHSSFGSHHSVQLSMRPADRQWRRSITPSSILKNKLPQPISPLSEFHTRPTHFRQRTTSASVAEPLVTASAKRRFNSSPTKQSSAPQPAYRTPSVSIARLKRRRTANPSYQDENTLGEAQITMWNPTPRRSREPASPFYSSQPALARTNSDVTSRPSQRSVAVVGKSTPFAYATPHSGPFIAGAGFGGFSNGGDTEPDDDDDAYEGDDGELSWRGVTDGDDNDDSSSSESSLDAEAEAQIGASFSGDDSGFGSESDDDDDDEQSEFDVDRNPHHNNTTDDQEEDGDVFDTLLDVLEH